MRNYYNCEQCGKPFSRIESVNQQIKHHCCSRECANLFKRGKDLSKMKGRIKSPEWSRHISEAKKGKKLRPFTEEHKQNISKALKGKTRSQVHSENISIAKKGICTLKPHTIEKFRTQFKGAGNPFYGRTHSFATRQIIIQKNYERDYISKETSIEVKIEKALLANNISFEKQKKLHGRPDFFIKPDLCVFCDGDYYHANPKYYGPGRIVKKNLRADQVWEKDNRITVTLELMGYKVLRFWETDINENLEACIEQIKQAIGVEQVICR